MWQYLKNKLVTFWILAASAGYTGLFVKHPVAVMQVTTGVLAALTVLAAAALIFLWIVMYKLRQTETHAKP